jgi:hypothetical protein
LVILKHASLFFDSYTEQVSSPVSCSISQCYSAKENSSLIRRD